MRFSLILLAVPLLLMVAVADDEFVKAGPYEVSFDMGAGSPPYQVIINESKANAGYLDILISSDKEFAYINGYPNTRNVAFDANSLKTWLDMSFEDLFKAGLPRKEVQYYRRNIDGQEGVLGVLDLQDLQLFITVYKKDFSEIGSIIVEITSVYPWNRGTESLLNSINVKYSRTPPPGPFGPPFGSTSGAEEAYGTPFGVTRMEDISNLSQERSATSIVNRVAPSMQKR